MHARARVIPCRLTAVLTRPQPVHTIVVVVLVGSSCRPRPPPRPRPCGFL